MKLLQNEKVQVLFFLMIMKCWSFEFKYNLGGIMESMVMHLLFKYNFGGIMESMAMHLMVMVVMKASKRACCLVVKGSIPHHLLNMTKQRANCILAIFQFQEQGTICICQNMCIYISISTFFSLLMGLNF
jgi:hypothetical protein